MMLQEYFKDCSPQEDKRLRKMLNELKKKGYISLMWADNVPCHIDIYSTARTHKVREDKYGYQFDCGHINRYIQNGIKDSEDDESEERCYLKPIKGNRFLFVTANEHEREAFEKKFTRQQVRYILGKTYHVGLFGCYSAAYIHIDEQGVTSPAATQLVSQLVNELRPIAVVMVGIAFGADTSTQKIGDVLVSEIILPYDSQKLLEDKTEYKEIPKEVGFQLLNAFREHREWIYKLPSAERSNVHIGAMLTGSRLINNSKYRTKLLEDFASNRPIGGEMEAQGIYSMCQLYGIAEWIIVKGICDWGCNKNNPYKERDQEEAALAAVDYCYHVFSRDGVFANLLHGK
jgi:nucleoside phosphorylase